MHAWRASRLIGVQPRTVACPPTPCELLLPCRIRWTELQANQPSISTLTHIDMPGTGSLPSIPALTGLRFFAAFFILFSHAGDWLAHFQNADVRPYLRLPA